MSGAERLAQGWVEGSTDCDFDEIPAGLQADLIHCARDLIAHVAHMQPRVVSGGVLP